MAAGAAARFVVSFYTLPVHSRLIFLTPFRLTTFFVCVLNYVRYSIVSQVLSEAQHACCLPGAVWCDGQSETSQMSQFSQRTI